MKKLISKVKLTKTEAKIQQQNLNSDSNLNDSDEMKIIINYTFQSGLRALIGNVQMLSYGTRFELTHWQICTSLSLSLSIILVLAIIPILALVRFSSTTKRSAYKLAPIFKQELIAYKVSRRDAHKMARERRCVAKKVSYLTDRRRRDLLSWPEGRLDE